MEELYCLCDSARSVAVHLLKVYNLIKGNSELAHQWFGNLVTMDWWNELWLNEGFATWVGWLAVDHFYPGNVSSSVSTCEMN